MALWSWTGAPKAAPPPAAAGPLDVVGPVPEPVRRRLEELGATSAVPEGRIARDLRIAHVDDLAFTRNATLSLADAHWPDSIRYGFFPLDDAVVTPFGFVIAGDRLVFDAQILPNGWMKGGLGGSPELVRRLFSHNSIHGLDVWRETCRLSLPADIETLEAPAFLFSSRLSCFNFAHLVHDTLIQAPTFCDACGQAGASLTPLLVGPGFNFPAMPAVFARALGPGAKPHFLKNRFLRVPRLYVPTTHFAPAQEAIARGAVLRLRGAFAHALRDLGGPPRRLFISREDSGRGDDREPRFRNADALMAALARLGIEPVAASKLGVEEYLKTFANAELIVGLHGAGLANAVLSAQARVVEITVPGYPDWRSLQLFIDKGMGAPFRRVEMAPPRDGLAEYDIPAIAAACEALLGAPCRAVGPRL